MKITPIEIRQKDFQRAFRGYEKEEVDAFLLSLSQEWERVMEENKDVRRKLEGAEREHARLKEVEASLFKTLKTAEDTGANMIEHANRTAELHMREAQMRAEAILNEAKSKAKAMMEEAEDKAKNILEDMQDEARKLQNEYNVLVDQKENILQELRNIANDTLEKVNRISARRKGFDDKVKDLKNIQLEKKTLETNTELKAPEIKFAPIPKPEENVRNENSKKENPGSFFDSIP